MSRDTIIHLQFVGADVFADTSAVVDGRDGVGVGVSAQHGDLILSIDDGEGTCLVAYLGPEALDAFADELATAIDQLNAAERAALGPSALLN